MELAWRATGLILYNPTIVFRKFSIYANGTSASRIDNTGAGSNMLLRTQFLSGVIPSKPGNIE